MQGLGGGGGRGGWQNQQCCSINRYEKTNTKAGYARRCASNITDNL